MKCDTVVTNATSCARKERAAMTSDPWPRSALGSSGITPNSRHFHNKCWGYLFTSRKTTHCSVELWLRTRRPRVTTMPSRRTGWLCVAAEGTKCCPRSDLSEIVQGARKADKDAVNHLTEGEHCVSVFFCRTERIKGYQRHSVHSLLVVFRYLDLDKVVI